MTEQTPSPFFKRSILHHLHNIFSQEFYEQNTRDRSKIHIPEITGCSRKLWLNLRMPDQTINMVSMAMKVGTQLHVLTQEILQDLNLITKEQTEVPVIFNDYPVIGSADVVSGDYVVDLKFQSSWSFDHPFSESTHAYKMQVLLYAYGLGKKFGTVFAVNRGTLGFKAVTYMTEKHIHEIRKYLNRAKEIYESETMPHREHQTPDNFECRYCPHKSACWESFDE